MVMKQLFVSSLGTYSVQRAPSSMICVLSISFLLIASLLGLNDGPTTLYSADLVYQPHTILLAPRHLTTLTIAQQSACTPQPAARRQLRRPTTSCALVPSAPEPRRGRRVRPSKATVWGRVAVSPTTTTTTTGLGARSHLARNCTRPLRCRAAGRPTPIIVLPLSRCSAGDETF